MDKYSIEEIEAAIDSQLNKVTAKKGEHKHFFVKAIIAELQCPKFQPKEGQAVRMVDENDYSQIIQYCSPYIDNQTFKKLTLTEHGLDVSAYVEGIRQIHKGTWAKKLPIGYKTKDFAAQILKDHPIED